MAAALALRQSAAEARAALGRGSVAAVLARSLGARERPEVLQALNSALVLIADHELNPSSFAARVAASAGADLYASVSAGLATLSGPHHGAFAQRVEALVVETGRPERAAVVVRERTRRGEGVPGFGHPLYSDGDPRATPLLEAAERLGPRSRKLRILLALIEAMRSAGRELPTIDVGMVGLTSALGLPPGSASAIYAIGRAAGWIGHILEQREAGYILRPRAHYVGPRDVTDRSSGAPSIE
jgi:citrate synthase